jgi:hypothetical protein
MNFQDGDQVWLRDGSVREAVLLTEERQGDQSTRYFSLNSESAQLPTLFVRLEGEGRIAAAFRPVVLSSVPLGGRCQSIEVLGVRFTKASTEEHFSSPVTGIQVEDSLTIHTFQDRDGNELLVQSADAGIEAYMAVDFYPSRVVPRGQSGLPMGAPLHQATAAAYPLMNRSFNPRALRTFFAVVVALAALLLLWSLLAF